MVAPQLAYADRALSQSLAQRLENESAAKREGFVSSFREESIRPIEERLAEYMTHLKRLKRDVNYRDQLEQRIRRMLDVTKAKRLIDLDAGKLEREILKLRSARGFEKESPEHDNSNEYRPCHRKVRKTCL